MENIQNQPHDISNVVEPRVGATTDGQSAEESRIVAKLTAVGILGNIVLVVFKFVAGIVGNSAALVSDAVHSASDVLATAVAYAGTRIAGRPADESHPYGHERFEQLAALVLAAILAITGFGIGSAGIEAIATGSVSDEGPGIIAAIAAAVSIAIKEAMFWYTRHGARKIGSDAFMADAWHHRSDALSSVAALAGVIGARLGFPLCDPIASVIICIFIFKVAFEVGKDAVAKLVDESGGGDFQKEIAACAASCGGVDHVDSVVTRRFGSQFYADVEVAMDGSLTLDEAHERAEVVHEEIERNFENVKHVTVHVNPSS